MRSYALTLIALVASACGAAPPAGTELKPVVERFHDALRWEVYDQAAHALPPGQRQRFLEARLTEGVRITDWMVGGLILAEPPAQEAIVTVKLTWFRAPDMTVQTTLVRERWKLEDGGWLLIEDTAGWTDRPAPAAQNGIGSSSNPPPAGPPPPPAPPPPSEGGGPPQPPPP